jgi:hypothetical protein
MFRAKVSKGRCKGAFLLRDAKVCEGVLNGVTSIQDSEPDFQSPHWNNTAQTNTGVSFGDPMEHERIDESRCYVCGWDEGCALCMQTHYILCSQCRNSNPTQGWWDANEDLHLDSAHGSSVDAEVFEADGAETLSEVSSAKVHDILMSNPDHTVPAKRGNNVVSINSVTGRFKYEPFGVRKLADKNRKRAKKEANNRQDLKEASEKSRKITSMFQSLFPDTEESFDSILDGALTDFGTELNAKVNDMHLTSRVSEKDVQKRLWDFHLHQSQTKNVRDATLANAYIMFEQYLREGDGTGKVGFSELKAGRTVVKTVFPRPKQT